MAAPSAGFAKLVLFVNGLVPAALIGWDAYHDRLGANPIEFVLRSTGFLALTFLTLTLAVTPVRKLTGWHWLAKLRRMLGLFAFFYGVVHFGTYLWFDQFFSLSGIAQDVVSRPFITLGFAALILMTPLAVTSTNGWIKRLGGPRWRALHRRVYLVGGLAVVHYWWAVKADILKPLIFCTALLGLLAYRWVTRPQS
jgi:sulfoxide reductase heme-binding subunit YedZ